MELVGHTPCAWSALSSDRLLELVGELESQRRSVDVEFTLLLAELESRGLSDREHGLGTGSFVARETDAPVGVVRGRVESTRVLFEHLPLVAAAFTAGELPWSKIDVLCRAARNPRVRDALIELQGEILQQALLLPHGRWRQFVGELVDHLDTDGAEPRVPREDQVRLTPLFDGSWDLSGVLFGESGASVNELLDREMERLRRQHRSDAEVSGGEIELPAPPVLRAMALRELVTRGALAKAGGVAVTDLTLVTTIHTCEREHDEGHLPDLDRSIFRTLDGTRLRGSDIEARLCDAAWQFLSVNAAGVPLDLGRTERFATPAQRRAARERDGGCVFPGCDRPASATDLHHVWHWDKGGPTDIGLLASLCRHHHRVTHRAGWSMEATDDQWFFWTTPAGRVIWSQRHGIPKPGTGPLSERAGPLARAG